MIRLSATALAVVLSFYWIYLGKTFLWWFYRICFIPDILLYKFGKPRNLRHVDLTLAHDKIICSTSLASGQQCSVCFNRVEIFSCFLALYCAIRRLKLLLATSVKYLFYISTGGSGLNKYEKVLNTTNSNACSVKLLGKPT